jgi:hypothetical protein
MVTPLSSCRLVRRQLRPALALLVLLASPRLLPAQGSAPVLATATLRDSVTTEYVVYFISAAFCVANRQPGFHEAVARLRPSVLAQARATSRTVSVVGVSVDPSADTAVAYLQRLGEWDEIAAGRNWMNTAVVRYVWQNGWGPPVVPQVIVVRHTVTRSPRAIVVGPDEKVLAATGHDAIVDWIARGTPIP